MIFLKRHTDNRLKRWEIALALSLSLTLCQSAVCPELVGCNWWGVMFPGFTEEAAAPAWNGPGISAGGVELRLWLLDRLAGLGR